MALFNLPYLHNNAAEHKQSYFKHKLQNIVFFLSSFNTFV